MIAAIYARKSTVQAGARDKSDSVERQLEHARAYAARKGWTIAEEHAYFDDGISGAEFGDRRPGLARLLNALRPQPRFQALIMSEESRLGREQIETAYMLKQIMQAGVRVFFYLEDRERTLDSALDKAMLSLSNFAAELEREKARQRTHDALARKARALYVTGGRVYGYDNIEVLDADGKRQHVVRQINAAQAAVVRRIFSLCAEGVGITRIAKALNEDDVAPPRGTNGWAPTAVREILRRPLYSGEIVWNRVRKRDQWGVKRYMARPEADWLRLQAPKLRIVPEELWQTAHGRLERRRRLHAAGERSGLERPHEKYLLSGIAKCAACGGSLVAFTRDLKRTRSRFYGCMYHHKRGTKVCSNGLLIRQDRLDEVVLDAIAAVLDARLLECAVEKAVERLCRSRRAAPERCGQLERELADVEARIQRGLDALLAGTAAADELQARLKAERARKAALATELEEMKGRRDVAWLDDRHLRQELRARVTDARGLLGRNVPQTRQILRKLLVGRLACEPFEESGRRGYRFTGQGSYAELLPGKLSTLMVTPAGFEPAISTLKGSRPGPG